MYPGGRDTVRIPSFLPLMLDQTRLKGEYMKLLNLVIHILSKICGVFLVIMTFVTFAQAVYRYVFGGSFVWSEELTILGMVWVTFLGSTVAIVRGSHTRIDFLINLLPAKGKRIMEAIDYICMAVFCGVLSYVSFDLVSVNANVLTNGLGIPRAVMYSALTVGTVLMVLTLVIMAVCKIMGWDAEGGK